MPASRVRAALALALALLARPVAADDLGHGPPIALPPDDDGWGKALEDPVLRGLIALDNIAPFEDLAPLWDWKDAALQAQVQAALARIHLDDDARRQKLAVALVDLTDPDHPRVASVNGDAMMYAASLPKIAVLLAAFEKIAQGNMAFDDETRLLMEAMIRRSDNTATTELIHRVGKTYIARVLLSPRYRLYDPKHNGGLWVGKDYAKAGLWKRDPLHNLSHGATAMQVARFYYLLYTDNLVTPEYSRRMKQVMSGEHINHKFVKALVAMVPRLMLFRKSGSWGTFHSDSALIEHDGKAYIAVALSDDPEGSEWMGRIIVEFDHIVIPKRS